MNIQWTSVAGPAVGAIIALLAALVGIFIKGWVDRGEWRCDRRLQAYADLGHHSTALLTFRYRHREARAALDGQDRETLFRLFDDLMRSYAQVDLLASKDVAKAAYDLVQSLSNCLAPLMISEVPPPTNLEELEHQTNATDALLVAFNAKARKNLGS